MEPAPQENPTTPPVTPTPPLEAPAPAPVSQVSAFDPKDVAENKYVAALSYIGILCLVPLLLKRESPYAQFHAKQGLVLAIAFIVGTLVFWIPLIGWAAFLALFTVDIIALVKTLEGQAWKIPGVEEVVKKLNI